MLREERFPGAEWFSRSAFERLIGDGRVLVGGKRVKKAGAEVPAGAEIELRLPAQRGLLRAASPAELVWADPGRRLAIFRKAAEVPSYPLLPWENDAFANQVCAYLEDHGWLSGSAFAALAAPPVLEGGLLQRLDRDTSGLLMVALDSRGKERLHRALVSGKFRKTYLALTTGVPAGGEHGFQLADARDGKVTARPSDAPGASRIAVKIVKAGPGFARVEITTTHGARHIVRASLAALGAPLVGDRAYGGDAASAPFHQLHAARLELLDKSVFPAFPDRVETAPPQSFLDCARELGVH